MTATIYLRLSSIGHTHHQQEYPTFTDISCHLSPGWTGIVGPNGCGKSTLLKIASGALQPTQGSIQSKGLVTSCPQEALTPPPRIDDFQEDYSGYAMMIKEKLDLFEILLQPFEALSFGERKRLQLGCAFYFQPDILLLDEPSNHLDEKNRLALLELLQSFKGLGLLVSHDRLLLNELCQQCIVFKDGSAGLMAGNYQQIQDLLDSQASTQEHMAQVAAQKIKKVERELQRVRQEESRSKGKLSKRSVDGKDHSTKEKINLAKLTAKDGSLAGKKSKLIRDKEKIHHEKARIGYQKSFEGKVFFDNPEQAQRTLLHLPSGLGSMASGRLLRNPELTIKSLDKVAISGPNGSGKSSFLQWVLTSQNLRTQKYFYLGQELALDQQQAIIDNWQGQTKESFTQSIHILARLGADTKKLLRTPSFSPGEVRKIATAWAIASKQELLILDEPTNHLDLDSMRRLESALADAPIAILLVSHDRAFRQRICRDFFRIERVNDGSELIRD
ncbi:ATP-binding cassette domain-containing protein [Pseudobacteriovorax antillogorgiicola]|uniref:ATPase components of ABC transporters with duplicated ATPase domains n=1 Tax=Pseudobacteriovorax antillogorgiicola TaxID=1513793 RepID=A0A1Y6CB60_9BACT|nr:ATP-binding cassette domain-containing protein [Pseudobacteriovorax antillogorgiicola]TCS49443.1 ATPase subunit of ABC transporter with duplicated ATPase domains [Pseudobacteriovorax antillogorgiicola]SMF46562.1 ATPase components of ABC transporters with duplicated ATPase domains [Pseudobacteriovorax antillogorgiicola]